MAVGYDISASASTSSSASTGPVQFGNVTVGATGVSTGVFWLVVSGLVVLTFVLFKRKK